MEEKLDLDVLENRLLEDPVEGLQLLETAVPPTDPDQRARFLANLANALGLVGEPHAAEAVFAEARALPCEPFTRADLLSKSALLRWRLRQWDAAHSEANAAVETHRAAGPDGLEGSPDRGLPAALVVRGVIAQSHVRHGGDRSMVFAARDDFREALDRTTPQDAPRVTVSAVHNTALLALTPEGHMTINDALRTIEELWRRQFARSRSPRPTKPATHVRWARTALHWQLFGQSDEANEAFCGRILGGLERVHQDFGTLGAPYEAVQVALDLVLWYLEQPEEPWENVARVSTAIYTLDNTHGGDDIAALYLLRNYLLSGDVPAKGLAWIYQRIRGLVAPKPFHARVAPEGFELPVLVRFGDQAALWRPAPQSSSDDAIASRRKSWVGRT
ncbi:MAG: hypothetical protein ACYTG4_12100 [Planctomycetota bacterium]|jgi:hypothetical protein